MPGILEQTPSSGPREQHLFGRLPHNSQLSGTNIMRSRYGKIIQKVRSSQPIPCPQWLYMGCLCECKLWSMLHFAKTCAQFCSMWLGLIHSSFRIHMIYSLIFHGHIFWWSSLSTRYKHITSLSSVPPQGDSGRPLSCMKDDGQWYLAGLTSLAVFTLYNIYNVFFCLFLITKSFLTYSFFFHLYLLY